MSEMIERGAEAMRAKRRELIAQPLDRIWPDLMRAAIEAMRESTPDMNIKGGIAISDADGTAETLVDCSSACWQAMIDEALK